MRRILVVHCPIARSTAGNSFGPMTIRATTAITTNSPHPMSNIGLQLRTPPLPLGDPVCGNSAWQESAAPSGSGVRPALLPLRQTHEASARLLAPAGDESAG